MAELTQVQSDVQSLASSDKKQVATEALKSLSVSDQQDAVAAAGVLPPPAQSTTNSIWLIVVIAFVIVFVGDFFAIAYMYIKDAPNVAAAVDKLLLVFTTVTAFLAGLLAPSPVRKP
jgi:hypothetical protein